MGIFVNVYKDDLWENFLTFKTFLRDTFFYWLAILLSIAIMIALIGFMEAFSIAKTFAVKNGDNIDANQANN